VAQVPRKRPSRLRKTGAIVLDQAYLYAIDRLESLPENRSGADKTWVELALRAWREHYARAVQDRLFLAAHADTIRDLERSLGESEKAKEAPKRKGSRRGNRRPPR